MINNEKVDDAYRKTVVLWDMIDLSDEERIDVARKYLQSKGEHA